MAPRAQIWPELAKKRPAKITPKIACCALSGDPAAVTLVTDVTVVGSPGRAEHAILGVILAGRLFCLNQDIFVVAEPPCDVGTSA